ncbi:MAG: hypothetical protein ABIO04_01055 [Ferruginibacter sp.]
MSDKQIPGKITFIHHEKDRAVIEYFDNGRKKTIQADIFLSKSVGQKKVHRFLIGDQVTFNLKKTGSKGSITYAVNIQYQYNTALELLVNKATVENKFLGYIKITDDEYFVKEIESYLFFPLLISSYEIPPSEKETENAVIFKLENIEKPDNIKASLYNHHYIPEFLEAVQHFKKQSIVDGVISKITPFGIHVLLLGKLKARVGIDEELKKKIATNSLQVNSIVPLKIKYLSPVKIIVESAFAG